MDYDVPKVDEWIEKGLNDGGDNYSGIYPAAKAIKELWEQWEVLDERAVSAIDEFMGFLSTLRSLVVQSIVTSEEHTLTTDIPENLNSRLLVYQSLQDGLSDMIESGRLSEHDIPEDYQWLVDSLCKLSN